MTILTQKTDNMKKLVFLLLLACAVNGNAQTIGAEPVKKSTYDPNALKYSGSIRSAKKPVSTKKSFSSPSTTTSSNTTAKPIANVSTTTPAIFPDQNPSSKNIVYQYIDTLYPNSENHFPLQGNAGIGTNAPQAALEIKRNAGDTRKKNILLQLSNQWSANGQNEPSIMFSNGDISSIENVSYWTIGARVSGDKTLNTPQTFKISHKPIGSNVELEYFSVDSYQGKVKIGDVNSNVDGYKLFVEEGILTEKVKVAVKNSDDWFDNVFNKDYKLISLNSLNDYINMYHHLPDMPTTDEVMKNGIDLGKMNGLLLKKVEELTKYMIEIKTELDQTKKELDETKKMIHKN